jgi:hypothetical protein
VTRNILVNRTKFPVTVNLESALRHLREHNRHVAEEAIFWIDALCINQRDIEERTQQAQLMGDIYRRYRQVVVYLGDHLGDWLVGNAPRDRAPAVLRFDEQGRSDPDKAREGLSSKGHRQVEVEDVFFLISELGQMKIWGTHMCLALMSWVKGGDVFWKRWENIRSSRHGGAASASFKK